MKIREATEVAWTLSDPEKMPCKGTSLPPALCNVGAKLRGKRGSVCSSCYACKGRYAMPNVKAALERRSEGIGHLDWADAMATLIRSQSREYFRWHDAGDIQGPEHLAAIEAVCRLTPETRHWLPTKEYGLIRSRMRSGEPIPRNLTIRVSAPMIAGAALREFANTSTVDAREGFTCPAPIQGGYCRDCRACWDGTCRNVDYKQH